MGDRIFATGCSARDLTFSRDLHAAMGVTSAEGVGLDVCRDYPCHRARRLFQDGS